MKKIAFICVHNSCRSQIAEALGKHFAAEIFESYSAGTETKPQINQDAVRIMKELYGIDMEETQYSKLITDIPNPDIAISMGCNVGCPFIGRAFDDNWGLEDPTGKSDEEFKIIIEEIENKVLQLKNELIIHEATDRIKKLEMHFDTLLKAVNTNPAAILEDTSLREMLRILTQYYESGKWLHDYELDEHGLFPQNLKRGVLSQDSVYELLERIIV